MMKIAKRLLAMILTGVMIFGITAYADTKDKDKADKEKVKNTLTEIAQKYDVKVINIDSSKIKKTLTFKSVKDYENFVRALGTKTDKEVKMDGVISVANNNAMTYLGSSGSDSYLYQKWVPYTAWGLGGLTTTRNISFTYDYSSGTFTKIYDIDSWLSGLDFVYWSPKNTTSSFTNSNKTANIKIIGEVICGVEVEISGVTVPLGASVTQTWTCAYTLQ